MDAMIQKNDLVLNLPNEMTPRTAQLREMLFKRAKGNRAGDWLSKGELPDLSIPGQPGGKPEAVIIRRAKGIAAVLKALTDPKISARTNSYTISPGELLVGVLPMGSNGLGKVFPDYLTREERQMASLSNRSEFSIQGHNSADYNRLVKHGMRKIIADSQSAIKKLEAKRKKRKLSEDQIDQYNFYKSVIISCTAVVEYAARYAQLAEAMAAKEKNKERRNELLEIARICKKVPMEPADTFHEAVQSILFLQIGFRSGMDLLSLGRLDQTLQPFLVKNGKPSEQELKRAVELVECLVIKLAGPMNLSTSHLIEQDHIDFGVSMGISRWYSDQRGNINQFLQNVVIGGVDSKGRDATVESTYILLQAWKNVNLPTPGIYVRLHKDSPKDLINKVAESIAETGNLPSVINDETVIPGFLQSFVDDNTIGKDEALKLVRDYCVDGCWEPILNGQGDWTFNMINGLTALECALNEGDTLDAGNMQLKGGKRCYHTKPVTNYKELMMAVKENMDFILFQSAAAMYNYYLLDEYVTPAPLLSAFLGSCMERGHDKSWGGCSISIGGTVLSGLPNMVNSIAAIKKWVFETKTYQLDKVVEAFRNNFGIQPDKPKEVAAKYKEMFKNLRDNSPRYGTNDPETDRIAATIVNDFFTSLKATKELTDKAYREKPEGKVDPEEAKRLRIAGGFFGSPFDKRYKTTVAFTAGLGTFAAFTLMGMGVAASVDRFKDEPLTKNNGPSRGTNNKSFGHIFASLKALDLSRFAAGAPVDLTLDIGKESRENKIAILTAIVESFMKNNGQVLSVTLGNKDQYEMIHNIAVKADNGDTEAAEKLLEYANVMVRAGGWQTPFITMSIAQQSHYLDSAITA
ncbi:MAG: pyruvate formate lyase family protein [Tannerella sp.]|jgi:formate C-acetyltransferase|nr:pyruvate formate lyase family protein [Tannerella sp.]